MSQSIKDIETHYDEDYFAFQQPTGAFGGTANAFIFRPFIRTEDRLLDFGCGGGYLLAALDCAQKTGVEINPAARAVCRDHGLDVYASLDDVPPASVDVVTSNHALEHVRDPFGTVTALRDRLVDGGRAVVVVPWERHDRAYDPADVHQHLYTWHPQGLGNLFATNGFTVERVEELVHRWPPAYMTIQRTLGWRGFHLLAQLYGRVRRDLTQVRIVARKR